MTLYSVWKGENVLFQAEIDFWIGFVKQENPNLGRCFCLLLDGNQPNQILLHMLDYE